MTFRTNPVLRSAALLVVTTLIAGGCVRTDRDTVLSSDTLKVVAVTESRLDINISQYRHYTTYELFVEGRKLSDSAFSHLLQQTGTADDQFIHSDVVVLGDDAILLSSHNRDSTRCWTSRLSAAGGEGALERIIEGTADCSIRPAPAGWSALYDDPGNLILIREKPFQIHPMAGYWYVLWIEGDVAALYQKDRDQARLVLKLARISSDTTLAEQVLPMQRYAEPDLVYASPDARRQWLFDNFTVSMGPAPAIQLRPDNRLATITPEVWAEYEAIDRENKELDARARAKGQAWHEAQNKGLMEAEAAQQRPAE